MATKSKRRLSPSQLAGALAGMTEQEQVDFVAALFREPRCRNVIETVEDYIASLRREREGRAPSGRPLEQVARELQKR